MKNFKAGGSGEGQFVLDLILYCPNCGKQHIDEAKPDECEDCGHKDPEHFNAGERNVCGGGEWNGDVRDENGCKCEGFTPWLNPPHRSHRCGNCNYVWRPADFPTNGVAHIKTVGKFDSVLPADLSAAPGEKSNFQILAEMARKNQDIRMFTELAQAKSVKQGGIVGMGVDYNTILDLYGSPDQFLTILFVVNADQYLGVEDKKS